MLKWAFVFLIIAVIAAVFGFTGIAAGAAEISRFLFFLFVVAFVLCAVFGVRRRRVVVVRVKKPSGL